MSEENAVQQPAQPRYRSALLIAAAAVFAVALPVFLISGTTRIITMSSQLYDYGFGRYGIVERTGLASEELASAARQIRDYFGDESEFLDVRVKNRDQQEFSLYREREVLHMKDVKDLMRGVFAMERWAGAYLAVFVAGGMLLLRRRFWGLLSSTVRWSAAGSLAVIALISLLALVAFDQLFETFHVVSFANDLWLLDPYSDFLVIMFPEGFFLDATLLIAGLTVIEFVLIAVLAAILKGRRAPEASDTTGAALWRRPVDRARMLLLKQRGRTPQ